MSIGRRDSVEGLSQTQSYALIERCETMITSWGGERKMHEFRGKLNQYVKNQSKVIQEEEDLPVIKEIQLLRANPSSKELA